MNRLAVTAGIVWLSACGHMGAPPRPLYDGPSLSAPEVAILSGPVAEVDGVDVSRQGAAFALLPGCHVVTLQSQIGEGGVSGAWSADIRKQVYAFRMKAGHSYSIDVRLLPGNHSVGTANVGGVKVAAIEQDTQGRKIASVPPVRDQADIEACQDWAAREEKQRGQGDSSSIEEPASAREEGGGTPATPAGSPEEGAGVTKEPTGVPEESVEAPTQPAEAPEESADEPTDTPKSP